jgi:HAD superfamily hydrolase (TIGR01509 family)
MFLQASPGRYHAFLFDLNGTMIDDMSYHISAWHRILNRLGAKISLEKMKTECYGKNQELLERIFPGRFSPEEKSKMSLEKEKQYQKDFRPQLKLVNGLQDFLTSARKAGYRMAIGSAAIRYNIDFVLDGLGIREFFEVVVSADDVSKSKPAPETWLTCSSMLDIPPGKCLVFEDTPKGVESAGRASMDCIVILTSHSRSDFSPYRNIVSFASDFKELMPFFAQEVANRSQ